jgi:hypothetical protein
MRNEAGIIGAAYLAHVGGVGAAGRFLRPRGSSAQKGDRDKHGQQRFAQMIVVLLCLFGAGD